MKTVNNKVRPSDVLVLQEGETGAPTFRAYMEGQDLLDCREYVLFAKPKPVEDRIYDDQPQLVVMGSVNRDRKETEAFARMVKKKNPRVWLVYFSSIPVDRSLFDEYIEKPDGLCFQKAVYAIKAFRTRQVCALG